eukprot:gene5657-9473_t
MSKKVFLIAHTKEIIDDSILKIVEFQHPKTNKDVQFGILNQQLYEISETFSNKGSFFCDNFVIENGSFFILTKYDILFLLISILEKNRNNTENKLGMFCTIEQILSNHQELKTISFELDLICDCKELDDEKFYRLNDEKVMEWLSKKMKNISHFISEKFYSKISGSTINFKTKESYKPSEDEVNDSSLNFLCEYLSKDFGTKLCEKYKIPYVDNSLVTLMKKDTTTKKSWNSDSIKNYKKKRTREESTEKSKTQQLEYVEPTAKKKKSGTKFIDDKSSKKITSFFKKK